MKLQAYIFMEKKDWRILKTQWELHQKERGDVDILMEKDEVLVKKHWNQDLPLKNITIIA